MPKHNPRNITNSFSEMEKNMKVEIIEIPLATGEVKTVKMVSALEAKTYVTGKYSGREYLFDGAGSIQDVDDRDVNWLLEKRQGKACCGGGDGAQLFYIAEK